MALDPPRLPDVFSADELARAAGVPARQVRALIRQALIPTVDGALVTRSDAVRACETLRDGQLVARPSKSVILLLSSHEPSATRTGQTAGVPLLIAGSVHGVVLALLLILATVATPTARSEALPAPARDLVQLVFVAAPGPGGGGGGARGVERRQQPAATPGTAQAHTTTGEAATSPATAAGPGAAAGATGTGGGSRREPA